MVLKSFENGEAESPRFKYIYKYIIIFVAEAVVGGVNCVENGKSACKTTDFCLFKSCLKDKKVINIIKKNLWI